MITLKDLVEISAPSGREKRITEFITRELKAEVDEIVTNNIGNVIFVKRGNGKNLPKIALVAHVDEVGIVVRKVNYNKAYFIALYRANPLVLYGKKVVFENGEIGLITTDKKDVTCLQLDDLFIDISGAKNVREGDFATYCPFFKKQGAFIYGKALDNRAGCYVLCSLISMLHDTNADLYFVFSVQEEVGLRGAEALLRLVHPDKIFSIDTTETTDEIRSGEGFTIKICDGGTIVSDELVRLIKDECKKNSKTYQLEILSSGKTDVAAVSFMQADIPVCAMSIPCRNMHSDSEIINEQDVDDLIEILYLILKR